MGIARLRSLLVIALGALALSACNSTTQSAPLAGVPSASIEVPLTSVGCTTTDTCLALGASSATSGPTTLGEDRSAHGTWHPVRVPAAASARLDELACARTACLAGGAQLSGDLLWRYRSATHAVTVLDPPPGGQGVRALACASDTACVLIDVTSVVGAARLSWTSDAGATWTRPVAIPWSAHLTVTGVACRSLTCVVVATSGTHVSLEETSDAGLTWTPLAVSAQWRTMKDLHCWHSSCVALVSGETSSLVRSRDFAATWTALALSSRTRAIACVHPTRCVAVGQSASGAGMVTTITERRVHDLALVYAPSVLFDAACGTSECAAIGASTLVALAP